jgi:hypothetical protein
VVNAGRTAIENLRSAGTIGDEAFRHIEEEPDWRELGLGYAPGRCCTETSPSTCIGFSLLANLASLVRSTRQDVRVKKHARAGMDKLSSLL